LQRCLICNRVLKGEESISRKIGPTCWLRLQKVAKEDRAKRKARLKLKNNTLKGQMTIFDMEVINND
jgi:hypothetical protein